MKNHHTAGVLALLVAGLVFGSITLTKALAAASPPTLLVSAGTQPQNSLALAGALRVPFTAVRLTAVGGDITVSELSVRQSGVASEDVFDGIVLLDEAGEPLTDDESLEDGMIVFTDVLLIPKGTSRTIMVAANMAEDLAEFEGQKPALSIVDIRAEVIYPVQL